MWKTVLPFLLLCFVCQSAQAQDWPQWRGTNRDGVLKTANLLTSFEELKTNWTKEISSGYSGPTVGGGKVYVMDRRTKPQQTERVLCFDEKSGKQLWVHEYDAVYRGVGYVAGPRASVTIDGDKVYSIGTMGHAYCLNATTGKEIWKNDFDSDLKISKSKRMPVWGIAASPLVYRDLVIYHVGGLDACIIAMDKTSGKEVWRALKDRAQYSSPVIGKHSGKDVLICWTGDAVVGLKPTTGDVSWRFEFKPRNMPIGIATPVVSGNKIFLTSFYDGSLMLKMKDDGTVAKVWSAVGDNEKSTKALHSIISTPIWIDDVIYGVDSYGELRAIEAATGDRIWESDKAVPRGRWSTIHFVRDGGMVWMFNERGDLKLGTLSRSGFTEISSVNIIAPTTNQLNRRGGVCWSHPAFANGSVLVRNDKEIKSVSLKK